MTTSPRIPELCAGDRLTRDEFERRYDAMPHLKKAELIEGVVFVGSPVRQVQHGRPEHMLERWLVYYEDHTPGLDVGGNVTVRLDLDNEPQPDLIVRLPQAAGGRSRTSPDGYIEGPPELVIEVAASSVSYDLHQKLHAYRRNGVLEYLVHRFDDQEVDWFRLQHGSYAKQAPDADGVLKSSVFPGLWLDVGALVRADPKAVKATVERGCATAEHAAFVARLTGRHSG